MSRALPRIIRNPGEPIQGLPAPLPADEDLIWQGSPDFLALSRSAFHANALWIYFGLLLIARGASVYSAGDSVLDAAVAVVWLAPLFLLAMAMVYTMAWLTSRTTVYTITSRRIVMHIGVVLDLTLNLPFDALDGADLHIAKDGTGDLPVRIASGNKIAYLHLWPHARPWYVKHPEPMFRAIPNAALVGETLSAALAAVAPIKAVQTERPEAGNDGRQPSPYPMAATS